MPEFEEILMSDMSPEDWLQDLGDHPGPEIRSQIDDLMDLAAAEPSPVRSQTSSRDSDTHHVNESQYDVNDPQSEINESQPAQEEEEEEEEEDRQPQAEEQHAYIKREDSEMADYRNEPSPEITDSQPAHTVFDDTVMDEDSRESSSPMSQQTRKESHSPIVEEDLAYAQATPDPNSPPHTDDDDDDDVMIIEPSSASAFARSRWGEVRPNVFAQDNEGMFIKPEPSPDTSPETSPRTSPIHEITPPKTKKELQTKRNTQMKTTQKNIIKNLGLRGTGLGNGLNLPQSAGWFEPSVASSSSGIPYPEGPSYSSPEPNPSYPDTRLDLKDVDNAMRDAEDDHEWMLEDADIDEEFEALKAQYTRLNNCKKKQKSTFNAQDALELFKIEKQIALKERLMYAANRRSAEPAEEDEDSLFVSRETPDETVARHRRDVPSKKGKGKAIDKPANRYSNDDEAFAIMLAQELDGDPEDLGVTKSGKPRKRRVKPAKNAREWVEREEEATRQKARKKAQKQKGRASANTSLATRGKSAASKGNKGKGKAKASSSKARKGGKRVKSGASPLESGARPKNGAVAWSAGGWSGQQDNIGQMILDDLMYNDPLEDRLQNPIFNVAPEQEITGGLRTKASQFQFLFANIPNASASAQGFQTAGGEPLTGKAGAQVIRSDKKKLRDASKAFGYAQVKAMNGKWLIKGMTSTLYHHQLLGAQWMVQRELSSQSPHGGLLADSMGLGKTVQTLACMVGNPPGQDDRKRKVKSTLVVVPAGVIDQWLDEIRLHADRSTFPKIMKYKASSNVPIEILEDVDIVVTSYNEVMKQFPFPDKESRAEIEQMGYKTWWKKAVSDMGDLHKINWYRVVLDEAQAIKNNTSRTSLACQNLKAIFRWCLTGTPLLNRLEELFPYLRFLRANYSMDWGTFQKYFCDPNAEDCYARVATLLSYTMMRRTMKTSLLNRPILNLPPPHPSIVYIKFSQEEEIIYRITENRFRSNLNSFFQKGEARSNYSVFMVQLLRLRQCTSHPFMLEKTIKECWTLEDVNELRTRLASMKGRIRKPFYTQCHLWVEKSEAERQAAQDRGEEILPFGKGDYGHEFSFDEALSSLNDTQLFARVTCGICSDLPASPRKTDCGHIFCEDCITDDIYHQQATQESDVLICPTCRRFFGAAVPMKPPGGSREHDDDDDSMDRESPRSQRKKGRKGNGKKASKHDDGVISKGQDALGFEPGLGKGEAWVSRSDWDVDFPLPPSGKTAALKAILLKGFIEAPLDKVVIYVQFRTLARIIGRLCHSEGWGFLYLTGDCTLDDRTKAKNKFRDDPEIKIMIAGLKCGGLGLNFTWANRCISLDLWWNHAVEQQAFGRIFRIGQSKETHMTRIVVKNTVDMRMLSMQLHKLKNLEKAMHDGNMKETPNLSLNQLATLFGFLKKDDDDNIISIEPDYDDEEDDVQEKEVTPDRSPLRTPASYARPSPANYGNGEGSSKTYAVEIETDNEEDEVMEEYAR